MLSASRCISVFMFFFLHRIMLQFATVVALHGGKKRGKFVKRRKSVFGIHHGLRDKRNWAHGKLPLWKTQKKKIHPAKNTHTHTNYTNILLSEKKEHKTNNTVENQQPTHVSASEQNPQHCTWLRTHLCFSYTSKG